MKRKHRIMIIDDNTNNIQVAMSTLKAHGYSFSFATSGEEGLTIIQESPNDFDLILLDIMMPGINGYITCEKLKLNPATKDIPIIFLTANNDVDCITKGFTVGAVDYITKPFHTKELIARVDNHLNLYLAKKILQQNNIALRRDSLRDRKRFATEMEENQLEMIFMLTELMEASSDETGKHIRRMAKMSALLAKYHPLMTEDDEAILLHASPMHDIGKMTVDPELLHKQGPFTDEEFASMKLHTSNAYKLLKNSPRKLFKAAAIIAHQHHEKWNGEGYPNNLQGEDIHLYGRLVAVADVFDALTHSRCYKEAWPPEQALDHIKALKGEAFDPQVVDILDEHFEEFAQIC